MSILTRINNTPVYTSIDEALSWAEYNYLSGYHIHKHMGVTGYMGGRNHANMPLRTVELPMKAKGKPGYSPKAGSRIISIVKGKQFNTVATANTVYDRKGFPLLLEEDKVESIERVVDTLLSPVRPNVRSSPTPITNTIPVPRAPIIRATAARTSSARSSSYSGGGGY